MPVIGLPIKSSTLDGLDALLSTVQMPSGIPVATVAIDGAANAAILAAQILALSDQDLSKALSDMKTTVSYTHLIDNSGKEHIFTLLL